MDRVMLKLIGGVFTFLAIAFDLGSYWKQIKKTLRERHSKQVSTSSLAMKLSHYVCSIVALLIFVNFVGFFMELMAGIMCLITFIIVCHFKPKNWRLINFKRNK
jgi:hypothetical protein